jgi:hypothetical protein
MLYGSRRVRRLARPIITAGLLGTGCTVADGFGPTSNTGDTGNTGSTATIDQLSGGFALTLAGDTADTGFSGMIVSGAVATPPDWILARKPNGCVLNQSHPTCVPACAEALICSQQLSCVAAPTPESVGKIHVTGLGSSELVLTAAHGFYALAADAMLPDPPCAPGDTIEIQTEAGRFPSFTLTTDCIAPVSFNGSIKYIKNSPLKVSWTTSSPPAGRIKLQIDLGAPSRGRIVCDLDDTGSIAVAADLIPLLIKLGASGTPTVTLTRIATGRALMGEPSQVLFTAQQTVQTTFDIAGVSCAVNSDCASRSCQSNGICD